MKYILSFLLMFTVLLIFTSGLSSPVNNHQEARDSTSSQVSEIEYLNKLGTEYYQKSEFVDAMLHFNKALTIAKNVSDSNNMAKIYSNIGVIHDISGNFDKAISNYQLSMLIYDKLNNNRGKESALNNIGVVYEEMDMPQKALDNYFEALKIKHGNKRSVAGTYNNIANIYEDFLDNSDSAYYYYNKALEYSIEAKDEIRIALIKSNLGVIQFRKGQLHEASLLFNESYDILKRVGSMSNIANVIYYQGKIRLAYSDTKKALNLFLESIILAEKYKLNELQIRLYFEISRVYKDQNNYNSALYYYEKYDSVSQKLINIEKLAQISKLEMNYELQKNDLQISILKSQASVKSKELVSTKRLIYTLILILILVIIIAILQYHNRLLKKNQQLLLLQTQLFRSQTSPHFIFNSLMAIQTFLLENNTDAASKYLIDFAKLIRSILQNLRNSFVSLEHEIDTLNQYLRLEKLRFGNKFDIEFNVNVTHPGEIEIPPMIAQPFIENAIIHGLAPSPNKGLLSINFIEKDNSIMITIEDNGIGRKQSGVNKKDSGHKPMAIEITKKRIKLLNKRFNKKIKFNIVDLIDDLGNSSGTRIVFIIGID